MSGWRLFWALAGYVAFIVILIFLYFYKPFEDFFTLVINGLGYDNAMFWVVLIAAIVGFCAYHWRAYRLYIVQRHSVDGMVLASLRGSAFIAILFCAGAAVQSLLILCVYLLQSDYSLGAEFGRAPCRRRRDGDPDRDLLPDLLGAQGDPAGFDR